MAGRRIAYRKRPQNRLSIVLVSVVVLLILAAVSVASMDLKEQLDAYTARKEQLTKQIAAEEERKVEIEEYRKYTQTKKFAEEYAKEMKELFGEDNFYLDHDVYKNYSFPGTIYTQSCNSLSYNDRVTVLYGHNMLNGSMFATLYNFSDKTFFDEHPYFYIYTADRKLTYEVVSAFEYDSRHIMNSFDFKDDAVFQDWLDQAKNPRSLNSNVRDSVNLGLDSKLVVLSTCLNYGDGRYLVQGVLVSDEKTE